MWFFIWYWNIAQSASTTVVQDAVLAESLLVDELFFPRTLGVHPEKHGCILWLSDQCEALVQQVRSSARVLECGFGSSPAAVRFWSLQDKFRIFGFGRLGFWPKSGLPECLNEQFSIYCGYLRNMEFCRCQTPTHARCFEWKAAFDHTLAPCQMICKGGVEPPMFAQGLLCFLNGTLPFLANCLFPLKSLARMAWFLETVLLPRQLLLASLMHLSCKHLTSDEGYAVGSCLVKRQLQILAAPPPSPTKSMRYGQCSGGAYCL